MVKAPRIIDDELFEKVQKQLKLNSKYSPRNKKHRYLFGGLVYCACGERRVGDGPDGKKYYRCTARLHSFPLPTRCKLGGVNVAVLDALCWQHLASLMTDSRLVDKQIKQHLNKRLKQSRKGPDKNEIRENLKALEEEERRYAKMYGQNMMSDDVYEERVRNVMERREALHNLKAKHDESADKINEIDSEQLVEPFKAFINNMSFEDKQFTVRKIVDKIVATKEEVTICGYIPILDAPTDGKVKLSAIYRYRRLA